MPEDFEFAACYPCNQSSRIEDKVFGFWAMVLDFDPAKTSNAVDRERIVQLGKEIAKERPQDIEAMNRASPIWMAGGVATPRPAAFQADTPEPLTEAAEVMSIKLAHALYYRETRKCLTSAHWFASAIYQPQNPAFEYFTSFIKSLLSQIARGGRTNIKDYGDRFGYRWEYNECDDFFVYVAQFGHGLIAWGIVCGPGVGRAADGPLAQMVWRPGAWGARDARARDESPESEQEGTVPKPDAERLSSSDSDYDPLPPELEQMMLSHEPSALGERLARELDAYTISFITSRGGLLSPAGSSTLVSVRGSKYVLTAGHVWHGDSPKNGLKNADTILIPIKEGEPKRLSLRPSDFVPFGPEIPGEWNPWGPDVIMLSLPPDRTGSIQAVGRSFYNLSQTTETRV
jgi:hypothetical protein